MAFPTPLYDLKSFPDVYEPCEDTFLLLDALECDMDFVKSLNPITIAEIGSGSGVVVTFLASVLQNACCYFATDINPSACLATLNTTNINQTKIECLNMNLLSCFKSCLFDIVLFNPPYVVTDESEMQGKSISRAWAGGNNGREIINDVLHNLENYMSSNSVCYMVVINENNPEEIKRLMLEMGFETITVKERKIRGEHLFVLKFFKICMK